MTRITRNGLRVGLLAGSALVGCQCAEPTVHEGGSADGTDASTGVATGEDESETEATEGSVDVSPFLGVFHNEFDFIPFGREVQNVGDPTIANVEILPDGTARMTMESCDPSYGPLDIAWRWDARPGPVLELSPGPGETSLRFMARSDLQSLRITLDDCDLLFEVDGEPVSSQVFRPGRACWVNRCMPAWTVHIDYCDGEPPPSACE